MEPYQVVGITDSVAWKRACVSRALRASEEPIGDNDLWIASTALTVGTSLATRDCKHFDRVEGLDIISY